MPMTGFARQRGDDPDADGPHGHGQVVGQAGDPADLDPRGRFKFIHGDDRAGGNLGNLTFHPEVLQFFLQEPGIHEQALLLDLLIVFFVSIQ